MAGTAGQEPSSRPAQAVAQIVYSENALANLERVFDFLSEHDPQAAVSAAHTIREGVDTLSNHPLIGRTVASELRELVISYGKTMAPIWGGQDHVDFFLLEVGYGGGNTAA